MDQLSLAEVVVKSLEKGLPARRFVNVVKDWASRRNTPDELADQLTSSLLEHLFASPFPPSNILGYLTLCVQNGVTTAQEVLVHLLYLVSDTKTPLPHLVSLCNIILGNLPEAYTLSSVLDRPRSMSSVPDIGTSASASPSTLSTLGLLLPLLRQCSTLPAPTSLILLINRLLTSLQPYPAPPLDVGLEAGGLFQSLPDPLSVPLRDCLSGLMADLAVSQDTNLQPINVPAVSDETKVPVPSLPPLSSQLSIQHALSFELSLLTRSNRWVSTDPFMPDNHIKLIQLGKALCPDSKAFLTHLVQASLRASGNSRLDERVERWLFTTERLPLLLKWWERNPQPDWPFPDNLREALVVGFEREKEGLASCDTWISTTLSKLADQAEQDDDSGGFTQPEGWMMCSQRVTLIQRLLDLGLLQRTDASAILPGMSFPSNKPGESLTARVASAPKSHLRALSHIIAFAPGAAKSLAKEVLEALQAGTPPLDNLLVNLAQESNFLAVLGGIINPASWLEIIKGLLDQPEDVAARNADPQGSSLRFGELVVLAEAFVSYFKLPLPLLLQEAREVHDLSSLDETRRNCVNGWIKALYISQGIDDEIILSTSSADFYRLATSVISQTVLATARGVLDTETLQSGLSYFAQPLLRWSLAGPVDWLVEEVLRNGMIAGPHLVVLQALVSSPSFPDSILRVTGKRIAEILDPASGLGPVLQSSGFDIEGMKQKLSFIGISNGAVTLPLLDLRQQVSSLVTIDLAPPTWSSTLLDALYRALVVYGPTETMRVVLEELLAPPTVTLPVDGFTALMSWIVSKQSVRNSPLCAQLSVLLADLFDGASRLTASATRNQATMVLGRTLKYVLVALSAADPGLASGVADDLVGELAYQRETLSSGSGKGPDDDLKGVLDALTSCLSGDEEVRAKWPKFESIE